MQRNRAHGGKAMARTGRAGDRVRAAGGAGAARSGSRVRTGRVGGRVRAALAAIGLVASAACSTGGPASSRSSYELVIERIEAPADTAGDSRRTFVESDVVTGGAVVQDTARATLRLAARDPAGTASPAAPTPAVFATVDRYRVRYVRADGRNEPGVDVPHPWDGALTLHVSPAGESGEFVLVRAAAKVEPPLVRLRDGGGDVVIHTLAHVTFHGRDRGGARIEATGAIGVDFADWADPAPR